MYLFGASGHAKVIVDILQLSGVTVKGFFDDDISKKELLNIPVLGVPNVFNRKLGLALIAVGANEIRKRLDLKIDAVYGNAFHPRSIISDTVTIQEGTVVMASAVINTGSSVGRHCIINTSASVDHDCIIDDFVHIAPRATLCGGVTVGEGTLVGSGATIIPNITVGKWAVVGAGSVVIDDIPDFALVVGNPARVVKMRSPE